MKKIAAVYHKIRWFLKTRYFFALFCILLEFIEIMIVYSLLYQYFLPITVAGKIFSAGVLLYLINKDETPEFKLPWLFLLLIVPAVGALAFVVLSSTKQSEKMQKRFREAEKKLKPYLEQKNMLGVLKEEDGDAGGQAEYLLRATGMPCCRNTRVTYYKIGEEFHPALLESLKRATQFIFMEYFIIEPGAMWDPIYRVLKQKADEGVEIYLMYDDIGCMGTLPEKYDSMLRAEGIHCTVSNRFTPILSNIHNNRDHRKITVVDGREGFTGGLNLADEYINAVEKFGHWKDTAVKIEGDAVRSLTALFLAAWNAQNKESLDYGIYMETKTIAAGAKGAVIPFGDGPEFMYPESVGENVYLNMIHAARKYLYITTPYLICDHALLNALRLAAKKGVDVRIITPHIPDKQIVFLLTQSNYQRLVQDGVRIYEYTPGFIHAKNFVCDDRFAVCGTINMDYRSLAHHFECGVWMYDTDCITDMKKDFLETLRQSEEVGEEQTRFPLWKRLPAEILKIFTPLF